MMKLMTVLGTRPEIIRLSRVLAKLDTCADHSIVYTNQSYDYELSGVFFDQMRIRKPDKILDVRSDTLGGQIGNILTQTEQVFTELKPDAVLVLGDTNSALCGIIAKRRHIPLFHMEAGNRCFDWEVPEELNRRIIDHISDYNLAYTEHARRYLIAEGIKPDRIIVTGSPLTEVFAHYKEEIAHSDILNTHKLEKNGYLLVSCHREENVENRQRMQDLMSALETASKKYGKRVIMSLHPRTKRRIPEEEWKKHGIETFKPFGFFEYAKLQEHAFCVLSDSGTIQEESAILGFPAVQIRYSTERPEAFDSGSIVVCGMNSEALTTAISMMTTASIPHVVPRDYLDTNISDKVARFIIGAVARGMD